MSPILLFAFKRVEPLKKTIDALRQNYGAADAELFIFCDGPKNPNDNPKVDEVRRYVDSVEGFNHKMVFKSEQNKGLARSIIDGVSYVLESYDTVIVLEDDLVTSRNFLVYMNSALRFYKDDQKIFSISAFTYPIRKPEGYPYDVFFNNRACSTGWATWKDRWNEVDWHRLKNASMKEVLRTKALGTDFPSLIQKYRTKRIDSWAVPWCYHQFTQRSLTVYPVISKIQNVGFGGDATHTSQTARRFYTDLDIGVTRDFIFQQPAIASKYYLDRYRSFFSYQNRIKWKLIGYLEKMVKRA
jgi:hypothetical protein